MEKSGFGSAMRCAGMHKVLHTIWKTAIILALANHCKGINPNPVTFECHHIWKNTNYYTNVSSPMPQLQGGNIKDQ